MIEILLVFIIILVILFDRVNISLSKNKKNPIMLIGENVKSLSWKGFNFLELLLASLFLILISSLFLNISSLSEKISNLMLNYLPFVFVYEELAFYSLIILSSIWFVLRFHFVSFSLKKIVARELFNLIFIVIFVFIGHLIFNTKNLSKDNRFVVDKFSTYDFTYDYVGIDYIKEIKNYRFDVLHYNPKFYSLRKFSGKMYPNYFVTIKVKSKDDNRLNYQIEETVYYVYGEGIFLNGILIFFIVKVLFGSILWGLKTLKE